MTRHVDAIDEIYFIIGRLNIIYRYINAIHIYIKVTYFFFDTYSRLRTWTPYSIVQVIEIKRVTQVETQYHQ